MGLIPGATSRSLWPPTGKTGMGMWYGNVICVSRPDTLDPALMRPGRMDRKVEFGLPDLEVINKRNSIELA